MCVIKLCLDEKLLFIFKSKQNYTKKIDQIYKIK